MTMRRLPRLAALALLALASPAAAADTVTDKVFGANLLAPVTRPVVIEYRYELRGQTIERPISSRVEMAVREVSAEGDKKIWFDMFEGENRRQFGPEAARQNNPLVLIFLQRDVTSMGNLTGGASGYFQQQIRKSFNEPAEVTALEVDVDGRRLQATRVVVRPFRADPAIARFPKFREKAYEFVVADAVPGGLYRIASSTPDAAGGTVLEESMTFARVAP
jgi:hypothetical protein